MTNKTPKLRGALDRKDLWALPAGHHNDQPGLGLILDVSPSGSRSWVYRYKRNGKEVFMHLGPLKKMDAQQARQLHKEAVAIWSAGRCPKTERENKRTAEAAAEAVKSGITFRGAAERWLAEMRETGSWTNPRVGSNIEAAFVNYVYEPIGNRPMISLGRKDIAEVLKPIWHTKKKLGLIVRQQIYRVFDHAFGKDEVLEKTVGRNPADLPLMVAALLPKDKRLMKTKHLPSMPWRDVPAFMERLRERTAVGARALEMCILSTLRTSCLIGGRWDEIDERGKLWNIPGERMKNREDYTMPLTPRMLEILRDMRERCENEYIFPGYVIGHPISDQAMLQFLQINMEQPNYTVHGFRSSFRNWSFEEARDRDGARFLQQVPELALTHAIGDSTELSYLTSEGRDMTRELLTAWSAFCTSSPAPAEAAAPVNVIPIQRKQRAGARR